MHQISGSQSVFPSQLHLHHQETSRSMNSQPTPDMESQSLGLQASNLCFHSLCWSLGATAMEESSPEGFEFQRVTDPTSWRGGGNSYHLGAQQWVMRTANSLIGCSKQSKTAPPIIFLLLHPPLWLKQALSSRQARCQLSPVSTCSSHRCLFLSLPHSFSVCPPSTL